MLINQGGMPIDLDVLSSPNRLREWFREISRQIEYYNLDAIVAIGYRINTKKATQFRIWATKT